MSSSKIKVSPSYSQITRTSMFTLDALLYLLLYLFGLAFSFYPLVKWCRENEGFSWPWPHVESEKKRIKKLRQEQEAQKNDKK